MADYIPDDLLFYNEFEPKTKNRFYVVINGIPSFMIKNVSLPKISFNKNTIDHINLKRPVLGKGEWNDISMTLYEPIVPSGAQTIMEWVRLSYETTTGAQGYAGMYKKDFDINILGPVGDIISQWSVKGAFITDFTFSDLDWGDDAPCDISLTLAYNYAILNF